MMWRLIVASFVAAVGAADEAESEPEPLSESESESESSLELESELELTACLAAPLDWAEPAAGFLLLPLLPRWVPRWVAVLAAPVV